MTQLFDQLGFISAILAGFAFSFLGGLLSLRSASRLYPWTYGGALTASFALMIASVASVLASLGTAGGYASEQQSREYLALVSQAFLLGVVGLVFTFGCSGWLHSRRLGIVATTLACIAACVLAIVISPFVKTY